MHGANKGFKYKFKFIKYANNKKSIEVKKKIDCNINKLCFIIKNIIINFWHLLYYL